MYIYQHQNWPYFTWDKAAIQPILDRVQHLQGWLSGAAESLGFEKTQETDFKNITDDVITTSAIEGKMLDLDQVRSSIARKLGIPNDRMVKSPRHVDGVVSVLINATSGYQEALSQERLFGWHRSLFPTGYSGFSEITVGGWRLDEKGPMEVISGPVGRETVHFKAPDSSCLAGEMQKFIEWFNRQTPVNPIIKAGIASFWFVTLHPFDDGNGRIARALADMLLARAERRAQRFYSMSSQIKQRRRSYYEILEQTQKGSTDITVWLLWFLECLEAAILASKATLTNTLKKADFWNRLRLISLNERQVKMINILWDDFEGPLSSSRWAKITKCSQDTAQRDISELIGYGTLKKSQSAGRSTHYFLVVE